MRSAPWLRIAVWLWLGASLACAQQLTFEAATVKPAAPNDASSGTLPSLTPGRLEFRNVALKTMIYWAYGTGMSTAMNVSGGPDWLNRNRYTVEAVAQGNPSDRDFRLMMRTLLEERFALKTHSDTREIDVYALLPDRADRKPGPKVKPWSGTCSSGKVPRAEGDPTMARCSALFRPPGLVLEGTSMFPVADLLSVRRQLIGRIVQDRTGWAGPYNIEFEFDFNAAGRQDYTGPSIFTALKEQLGVKLEAAKGPLQALVVDTASLPGEN